MPREVALPTTEEVLAFFASGSPTDPVSLEWAPLAGLLGGPLRLRMTVTRTTISPEMVEAYRTAVYPPTDVPEVKGLLRVLEATCARAHVPYRLVPGRRDLQTGPVGFFEPHKIVLPFPRARLAMTIAPGEFQWVLTGAKKEKGVEAERLEALRAALLEQTREWLRRGNR